MLSVLLLVGCDNQVERLLADERACEQAVHDGRLQDAHTLCERALGTNEQIARDVRSRRLFALARVKRQLGRYAQAEPLLLESLSIAEAMDNERDIARRMIELSLVRAGLGQWERGFEDLEGAAVRSEVLQPKERRQLHNIVKRYADMLASTPLSERASALFAASGITSP